MRTEWLLCSFAVITHKWRFSHWRCWKDVKVGLSKTVRSQGSYFRSWNCCESCVSCMGASVCYACLRAGLHVLRLCLCPCSPSCVPTALPVSLLQLSLCPCSSGYVPAALPVSLQPCLCPYSSACVLAATWPTVQLTACTEMAFKLSHLNTKPLFPPLLFYIIVGQLFEDSVSWHVYWKDQWLNLASIWASSAPEAGEEGK